MGQLTSFIPSLDPPLHLLCTRWEWSKHFRRICMQWTICKMDGTLTFSRYRTCVIAVYLVYHIMMVLNILLLYREKYIFALVPLWQVFDTMHLNIIPRYLFNSGSQTLLIVLCRHIRIKSNSDVIFNWAVTFMWIVCIS